MQFKFHAQLSGAQKKISLWGLMILFPFEQIANGILETALTDRLMNVTCFQFLHLVSCKLEWLFTFEYLSVNISVYVIIVTYYFDLFIVECQKL